MASADDTSITDSSFLNTTYPTMNDSVATDGNVSSAPTEDELREQVSPERFYGIVVSFSYFTTNWKKADFAIKQVLNL